MAYRDDYYIKEGILNHLSYQNAPISASAVACAMNISTQRAVALLHQLCYEKRIEYVVRHSQKEYILKGKNLNNIYCHLSTYNKNNSINIEITVENENDTVEFTVEKESYKNKFLSLLYNIIYDYFYKK